MFVGRKLTKHPKKQYAVKCVVYVEGASSFEGHMQPGPEVSQSSSVGRNPQFFSLPVTVLT